MSIHQKRILEVLQLLQKAWIVNKKVKRDAYHEVYRRGMLFNTLVDYEFRDKMYFIKEECVKGSIALIRQFNLPIKYGKNDGVVYFEYCGIQVSFHDPFDEVSCKRFAGIWNQRINTRSPFSGLISSLKKVA